jgi:hypothetical protein
MATTSQQLQNAIKAAEVAIAKVEEIKKLLHDSHDTHLVNKQ